MQERHHFCRTGPAACVAVLLVSFGSFSVAAEPRGTAPRDTASSGARPGRSASTGREGRSGNRRAEGRSAVLPAATQPASRPASTRPAGEGRQEVIAYYFHRTLRCPSCMHIEATAKRAIEERFAAEIDAGMLRWKAVNMQMRGSEHFAADYGLDAPSLVLVRRVNGRQVSWKNCEKVWDLHTDEPAFVKYVQGELADMLSGRQATASRPATARPEK